MTREEQLNARRELLMTEQASWVKAREMTRFEDSMAAAVDFFKGEIDLPTAHRVHHERLLTAQKELK